MHSSQLQTYTPSLKDEIHLSLCTPPPIIAQVEREKKQIGNPSKFTTYINPISIFHLHQFLLLYVIRQEDIDSQDIFLSNNFTPLETKISMV